MSQSIPDHIDTYRARSEFLELRTPARRLTAENERLRHRLAGCLGRRPRPRRRVDDRAVAAAAPTPRRVARARGGPAVDAGVKA